MGFFENSKKAGRIGALISVIVIAGTLSIIEACNTPASILPLVEKWLLVAGPMFGFYFAGTQVQPTS